MKTQILVCFLLMPLSGKSDWVVVQSAENSSGSMRQTNQLTLKIKGKKIRIDSGPYSSTIMDNDSGDQIVLMHPQKRYMVQSASQMKEGKEMIKGLTAQADNESESIPKLQPTGKTEIINGYDAEEFVWEGKNAKGRCWVAKNFPNYAALGSAMESSFSDARKLASYQLPDFKTLPGFSVRTENIFTITMKAPPGLTPAQIRQSGLDRPQVSTNVTTLVSAKEESLSDSEFTVPADYKGEGANHLPSTNSAAGLRDVLKAMEKQGLSEADRKKFEQIIKNAEGQTPKNQK